MNYYALGIDKPRPQGIYHWALTPPGRNDQPLADGIQLLIPKKPGNWECDLTFTETSDFGFFEATKKQTIFLTTQNQSSASSHYHWSSGLIFDLGEINPLYAGQYIIAFQAGKITLIFGVWMRTPWLFKYSGWTTGTTCPCRGPCHWWAVGCLAS